MAERSSKERSWRGGAQAPASAPAKETDRVEIFSDGVFAIAITLLGLELKAPIRAGDSLAVSLAAAWPSYVAFFTSFLTITVIWINHHRLFTHITRVDHVLLLLNSLLLLTVTIVPFGTAVLAENMVHGEHQRTAAMLYNGIFMAVTGAFNFLWGHAAHRRRLLDRTVDKRTTRRISLQYGFGPLLYLLSFGLTFASPWASIGVDLLIGVFFALPMVALSRAADRVTSEPTGTDEPDAGV